MRTARTPRIALRAPRVRFPQREGSGSSHPHAGAQRESRPRTRHNHADHSSGPHLNAMQLIILQGSTLLAGQIAPPCCLNPDGRPRLQGSLVNQTSKLKASRAVSRVVGPPKLRGAGAQRVMPSAQTYTKPVHTNVRRDIHERARTHTHARAHTHTNGHKRTRTHANRLHPTQTRRVFRRREQIVGEGGVRQLQLSAIRTRFWFERVSGRHSGLFRSPNAGSIVDFSRLPDCCPGLCVRGSCVCGAEAEEYIDAF